MNIDPCGFYVGLRSAVVDKSGDLDLSPKNSVEKNGGAGGRARVRNAPVAHARVYVRVCALCSVLGVVNAL